MSARAVGRTCSCRTCGLHMLAFGYQFALQPNSPITIGVSLRMPSHSSVTRFCARAGGLHNASQLRPHFAARLTRIYTSQGIGVQARVRIAAIG